MSSRAPEAVEVEAPLRAEIFGLAQLQSHARLLARNHTTGAVRGPDTLLQRLRENQRVIEEAYPVVTSALAGGHAVAPAAEWLLDNLHVIEEQIQVSRDLLPPGYSRKLPRLQSGPLAGFPCVYELALELISHTDGRVDVQSLSAFADTYQEVRPLDLGELWAVPIMLRLALIENLRRVSSRITWRLRNRDRGRDWARRFIAAAREDPGRLITGLADLVREGPRLNTPFLAEMTANLQGQHAALSLVLNWFDQQLAERGQTIEQILRAENQDRAADQASIANSITSLRQLGLEDWRAFVEDQSRVERILREDPPGIYAGTDFGTRDACRHVVERLAHRSAVTERDVAAAALRLAAGNAPPGPADPRERHVGFYLIGAGRPALERAVRYRPGLPRRCGRWAARARLPLVLGAFAVATAALASASFVLLFRNAAAGAGWSALVGGLLLLVSSRAASSLVHGVLTFFVPPRSLPRMDFSEGIPDAHCTAVVVPALLASGAGAQRLLDDMERRYLSNRDANLRFLLLTDFTDAATESLVEDAPILEAAAEGIRALNASHAAPGGDLFFLLHRPRRWDPAEGAWMGRERKRGKLADFNRLLLRGRDDAFSFTAGDLRRLSGIRYVITLDSDTQLPPGAAWKLAGTLAHPLNRPVLDTVTRRVVSGYGVLQPRVSTGLESAGRTRFSRLFAGDVGLDPYTREVSNVYHDVFACGPFIGKGIYDVAAFAAATEDRFPGNTILSHDLIEGCHARCGFVNDVEVLENHPSRYLADVSRRHRWTRGDWQILGWLRRRVPGPDGRRTRNPLDPLSQWMILDNARRNLVPAGWLGLWALGWLGVAGPPLAWAAILLGLWFLPNVARAAHAVVRPPRHLSLWRHARRIGAQGGREFLIELWGLVSLPYEAQVFLDAAFRASWRQRVSGRRRLAWQTAQNAERDARLSPGAVFREMQAAPLFALGMLALAAWRDPAILSWAALPLSGWMLAPLVAWWISRPRSEDRAILSPPQACFLRRLARRTWMYFEHFSGPEQNGLPPDNYQEKPEGRVAARTSPTNIGLGLLSAVAARDFGYVSTGQLLLRVRRALDTMEKLDRYRGHFLNWYDTRTGRPLAPPYVSTVDSGNLAAHLLVLASALKEIETDPVVPPRWREGLKDTAGILRQEASRARRRAGPRDADGEAFLARLNRLVSELEKVGSTGPEAAAFLARWGAELAGLKPAMRGADDVDFWLDALRRQCEDVLQDLLHLAPWLDPGEWPRLAAALPAAGSGDAAAWRDGLEGGIRLGAAAGAKARWDALIEAVRADPAPERAALAGRLEAWAAQACDRAGRRIAESRELAQRAREMSEIDLEFLYSRSRKLFAIGFMPATHRLDPGNYDLLASEARLCSFLGIARNQVPLEHWFALGRQPAPGAGPPTLASWSGSMFEYLMPILVMPTYRNTLLDRACRGAVERQIRHGLRHGVPWGISESCYNQLDRNLSYQYRAFGVPDLGLKRGLADDLVVAPYASALALPLSPAKACANLQRMQREGWIGRYGLYEAVDFTPSRLPAGRERAVVPCYMAHHGGMTLLSLAAVLLDRPMQRRFLANPEMRAAVLLLQERVPVAGRARARPSTLGSEREAEKSGAARQQAIRVVPTPQTPIPEVHLLSNGRYHVMINNAGGGFSRWQDLSLTRWREDMARDDWGTFFYLQDVESGESWSAAHLPLRRKAEVCETVFSQGRAELRTVHGGVEVQTLIAVSPEDDVELRRITIINRTSRPRTLELTSYAEVVLMDPRGEASHPAFHNLFVETEALPGAPALLAARRARAPGEAPPWMLHLLLAHGAEAMQDLSFETDRARFVGRGRSPAEPAALDRPGPLGNTAGAVLDPLLAMRRRFVIGPGQSVTCDSVLGAGPDRAAALVLADRYQNRLHADRVFEMAWMHSQILLHQLQISDADAELYGRLAGSVLYANPRFRSSPSLIARNRKGQSDLWRHGISGDLPIVLARVTDPIGLELVRHLVHAHTFWRHHGLRVDLVVWADAHTGYRQSLLDTVVGLVGAGAGAKVLDQPGGIFVRSADQLGETDQLLLQAVARLVFSDRAGSLPEQVRRQTRPATRAPRLRAGRAPEPPRPGETDLQFRELLHYNGLGGFTPDGREYVIQLPPGRTTPAPWINVLANPDFGSIVSESGMGYTWFRNAHEYRLTPWHNDPVTDRGGEAFYIRDEESGRFWSPAPGPAPGPTPYVCRHGLGYTVFEHTQDSLFSEVTHYVATDAPVKLVAVTIRNRSGRTRRLSVTGYAEWVLGERRERNAPHVHTRLDPQTGALFAGNAYHAEFAGCVAFFQASAPDRTVTADRLEFVGRNGTLSRPDAMRRTRLSGAPGAAGDPCAAIQAYLEVPPGEQRQVVFALGAAGSEDEARAILHRVGGTGGARQALESVWQLWKHLTGGIYVETPDSTVNILANHWLLYQAVACRFWGRSGFYQSGGAFGFRDQLQDAMAFLLPCPWLARPHLLDCAGRQFREGDVQHWWHPPAGRGVRTQCSDDFLWLPLAVCRYVFGTGDWGVLDEVAPFLEGPPLQPDAESRYALPETTEEKATLYEHCVRAVRHGQRRGSRGLPLIGSGDWNDGLNRVGAKGEGESVWLAFFQCEVLRQFEQIAARRGDGAFAAECAAWREELRAAVEKEAWDGRWYRRAFFDDGTPLGSAKSPECRIDSLPQSWAALSGAAPPDRADRALQSVLDELVDPDLRLVRLLHPPFDQAPWDPGYIRGYVPGVRENGGQYTHGAVWAAMALAARRQADPAWRLFRFINPILHGDTPDHIATYRVEPYVLAADVYTLPRHAGRGGWTWYTGSAAWMYRLVVESLLGLRLEEGRLSFAPVVPPAWRQYRVHYRYHGTQYHIEVIIGGPETWNVRRILMDGAEMPDGGIPLSDDHREHQIRVEVG